MPELGVQRPGGRIVAHLALVALFAAGAGTGCQYATQRGRDFVDVFSLGVSDGGGVIARVVPTRFLAVEVGARKDETFYGIRKRHYHWIESSYGIPFAFFWSPRLGMEKFENWGWTDVFRTSHSKLLYPKPYDVGEPKGVYEERRYHLFVRTGSENTQIIDDFDLEVDASALIVGVHCGLSFGEFVDFLGGIVGLDPAGDDFSRGESEEGQEGQETGDS